MGNPDSFDFDVYYRVVPGASTEAIVQGNSRDWVGAFRREGQQLMTEGCCGLATTCGFLSLVRDDIASVCGVPVVVKALEQVPLLMATLPTEAAVGILTISSASLMPGHLAAAGTPSDTHVLGLDHGTFSQTILGNRSLLDTDAAEVEMITAAEALCARCLQVAGIVLECTIMPPLCCCGRGDDRSTNQLHPNIPRLVSRRVVASTVLWQGWL